MKRKMQKQSLCITEILFQALAINLSTLFQHFHFRHPLLCSAAGTNDAR